MIREFYEHLLDFPPGMVSFEVRESLFTRLKNKEILAENLAV